MKNHAQGQTGLLPKEINVTVVRNERRVRMPHIGQREAASSIMKLTTADIMRVAASAEVDPRTVRRALEGKRIRGLAGERVERALEEFRSASGWIEGGKGPPGPGGGSGSGGAGEAGERATKAPPKGDGR